MGGQYLITDSVCLKIFYEQLFGSKVNLSLCLTEHHIMKECGGMEV
jgi:hypothetical protein